MEAIEQGHGGPEVLFANQKNDAAERIDLCDKARTHMCRSAWVALTVPSAQMS
jgi:hypothetical protein